MSNSTLNIVEPTVKAKNLTKSGISDKRTITTSLVNKEEVFRMLALAESTGLPVLLVGPPGTGKTKTVLEYSKTRLMKDIDLTKPEEIQKANQKYNDSIFILETDEGTKSSDVKGMIDLEKLMVSNKYELTTPIATAEVVIVNEIDKASSNIRNSLLGVMNEKFLFNGKHKIPCQWKLMIGTCNDIPKEEKDSPFWDRFILKAEVGRVSAGELVKYFDNGGKEYRQELSIGVPNTTELADVIVSSERMEKYLQVAYSKSTDRSLTFVPTLVKAVSLIWNVSVDKALVKVCEMMIGKKQAAELDDLLISPIVKQLISNIDIIGSYTTPEEVNAEVEKMRAMIMGYAAEGKITQEEIDGVVVTLQTKMDSMSFDTVSSVASAADELEFA